MALQSSLQSNEASVSVLNDRITELAAGIGACSLLLQTVIRNQDRLDAMITARYGPFEYQPPEPLKQG